MPVIKTWIWSQLKHSRHEDMGDETVPAYQAFSNGMQYPGDPAGGVRQTANCKCLLEVRKVGKQEYNDLIGGG